MATDLKIVAIVPLNETNYLHLEVQFQMALVHDGLGRIVNGTETAPDKGKADCCSNFLARRGCSIAPIVLAVESLLLYLIEDPEDPVVGGKNYRINFGKNMGEQVNPATEIHSLQLKDGESLKGYIKAMMELFNELAIVGDVIQDEDSVIYLLARLPDSFITLATVNEADEEVSEMEIVTERILHEERKQKETNN